jgi:hypothetical protein
VAALLAAALLFGASAGVGYAAEPEWQLVETRTMVFSSGDVPAAPVREKPAEPPARPEPKVGQDAARETVEALFPAFAGAGVRVEFYEYESEAGWVFFLGEDDPSMGIVVGVDATTGQIMGYWDDRYEPTPQGIPTGPQSGPDRRAEAEGQAAAWLSKLLPNHDLVRFDSIYPDGGLFSDTYAFTWAEQQGGVPVPDSRVHLSIDRNTLELREYSYNLVSGLTFAPGKPQVTSAQAMAQWSEPQPRLAYHAGPTDEYLVANGPMELFYEFSDSYSPIDALTGEFVTASTSVTHSSIAPGADPVTPSALPLSDADALAIAGALMEVPEGDLRIDDWYEGEARETIRVYWANEELSMSAAFDQETGMLRYAYRDTLKGSPPRSGRVTNDQVERARQEAVHLAQTFYGPFLDQLRLVDAPEEEMYGDGYPFRTFHLQRYVNGLPMGDEGIRILIDLTTNQWAYIGSNWTDTQVEPLDVSRIKSQREAKDAFFADVTPQLVYLPVLGGAPAGKGEYREPLEAATEYALYWVLPLTAADARVDAYTGQKIGRDGEPVGALEAALASIAGHWAEGELGYLLNTRLVRASEFDPQAPVTRAHALQLLLRASGYSGYAGPDSFLTGSGTVFEDVDRNSPHYDVVLRALAAGWLTPLEDEEAFHPTEAVTRGQFVVWMARVLQLGDLARSEIQVGHEYSDLSGLGTEVQNAATFLRALGLLSPGERFRGNDPLTQAEAAALVVRLLNYSGAGGWYPYGGK